MIDHLEFVNNEQRAPLVLVPDISASTGGAPNRFLNEGLQLLSQQLKSDPVARLRVDVAIVTFGAGGVQVAQDFVLADRFDPPVLVADNGTPMGQAIHTALDLAAARKQVYKEQGIDYYRPWIFLVTDGRPGDEYQSAAERVHREEAARQIAFYAVGFGNVDMTVLSQIAPPQRPPLLLAGLKFRELFVWLSASQRRISSQKVGQQTALPPTDGWAVSPV